MVLLQNLKLKTNDFFGSFHTLPSPTKQTYFHDPLPYPKREKILRSVKSATSIYRDLCCISSNKTRDTIY